MWLVYLFVAIGIIFFLVTRQRNARRGVTGGGIGFSLPRMNFAVDWKIAFKLALLVGFWVFWIWFFPDTVPGKDFLNLVGLSSQHRYYPWVMQYIPTALLVWLGWRIFSANPTKPGTGLGGLIRSILWLGVLLAIVGFALYQIDQWVKNRPINDGVSLNGPGSPQRATINRKGAITVAFRVPVNQPGWLICQRLVEPTVVRTHGQMPRYQLKEVFKGSGVVTYELNKEMMNFVMKEDVTSQLTFEFELRQATSADPDPCPR